MWSTTSKLVLVALTASTHAYSDPGPCSGTCTNTHDPSIIRRSSDGKYFKFATGGLIQIYTAPSISGPWSFACTMLTTNAKVTTSGNSGSDLWAPDVSLVAGTYYVYYSVSSFGSQNSGIGLATSTSMDCGSFTDHGSVGVSPSSGKAYNAIDPSLYKDGSTGIYYLQFGSFWTDIFQIQMANPPTTPAPGAAAVNLAFDPVTTTHPEEGSFLVKYGGYYYLFFSWGACCGYDTNRPASGQEYHIKVCRSTKPNGGFVDATSKSCLSGGGTVVLESHGYVYGPGGQSVYLDLVNGWVLVYHYVDTRIGYADGQKQFGWNKINWSSGWPTV